MGTKDKQSCSHSCFKSERSKKLGEFGQRLNYKNQKMENEWELMFLLEKRPNFRDKFYSLEDCSNSVNYPFS